MIRIRGKPSPPFFIYSSSMPSPAWSKLNSTLFSEFHCGTKASTSLLSGNPGSLSESRLYRLSLSDTHTKEVHWKLSTLSRRVSINLFSFITVSEFQTDLQISSWGGDISRSTKRIGRGGNQLNRNGIRRRSRFNVLPSIRDMPLNKDQGIRFLPLTEELTLYYSPKAVQQVVEEGRSLTWTTINRGIYLLNYLQSGIPVFHRIWKRIRQENSCNIGCKTDRQRKRRINQDLWEWGNPQPGNHLRKGVSLCTELQAESQEWSWVTWPVARVGEHWA